MQKCKFKRSDSLKRLRKLTEGLNSRDEEIKRNNQLFEIFLMNTPYQILVWTVNNDLKFTYQVGTGTDMKIAATAAVGVSLYDFFGTSDPEFEPIKYHLRALSGETCEYTTNQLGQEYWTRCAPLRSLRGNIVGVAGIAWNMTERYEVLRRLEGLQHSEIHDGTGEIQDIINYINGNVGGTVSHDN